MGPVSRLSLRFNFCRLERLPNSTGMLPTSWLSLRFNTCSWERLPSPAGMLPVSLLPLRLNRVTRELETRIPSQAFMREVVLQLSEAVPRRVSLAASSTLQSATRPADSGSGTAMLLAHADTDVGVAVGVVVAEDVAVAQNGSPRFDRSFWGTLLKALGIHPLNRLSASHN